MTTTATMVATATTATATTTNAEGCLHSAGDASARIFRPPVPDGGPALYPLVRFLLHLTAVIRSIGRHYLFGIGPFVSNEP